MNQVHEVRVDKQDHLALKVHKDPEENLVHLDLLDRQAHKDNVVNLAREEERDLVDQLEKQVLRDQEANKVIIVEIKLFFILVYYICIINDWHAI